MYAIIHRTNAGDGSRSSSSEELYDPMVDIGVGSPASQAAAVSGVVTGSPSSKDVASIESRKEQQQQHCQSNLNNSNHEQVLTTASSTTATRRRSL